MNLPSAIARTLPTAFWLTGWFPLPGPQAGLHLASAGGSELPWFSPLLVSMGLLRGDVIKLVNDMKLDSPEKALQILQQLREARRLTVDIERFGKPMTFTYELE